MNSFTLIPAIDIMDGQCVRLQQGDAQRLTNYPDAPAVVAEAFQKEGASRLHIVDLDGAFAGKPANLATIKSIRDAVTITVEVGGGIRTEEDIKNYLDIGVDHVIIGTRALEDKRFLGEMVRKFGASKIIIGADARNGYLSTRGWTSDSKILAIPFLQEVVAQTGVGTVIFTDIARDGMFNSPNFDALEKVCGIGNLQVIASGGVGSDKDIRSLIQLKQPNLIGAIVGKAIHDGRLSLHDALKAAKNI